MQKNKVTLLLNSLTSEEMRLLDKFVQSPVHNKHGQVTQLFHYLKKHLGSEKGLQKERVFGHLFPEQDFDMQQVHYLSSYLIKVVEEFLAWQEWRKNETSFDLHLIRALKQKRLEQPLRQSLERAGKYLEQKPPGNPYGLWHFYQFHLEKYDYERAKGKVQADILQKISKTQDEAFMSEKLKNACVLLSHQAMTKASYDMGLLVQVMEYLDSNKLPETPALLIYFHAYRALSDLENVADFHKMKALLLSHRENFSVSEVMDLYILSVNYCIRRLNNGDQNFMLELFNTYKAGLDMGVLVDNGVLSTRTYSNVVMSGLKLGEYGWVENFIYEFKDSLPEKQREGFFNYNLARLFYEKKNYQQAMSLLLIMDFGDVLYTCLAKILLAKMYYEQDEFDSLSNLLQSFRAFVQRKKMLGYHRESYLNFIHFMNKLMQHLYNPELKKEIEATNLVLEKEWLMEQAGK